MKIHRNLVDAVIRGLQQIFNDRRFADRVIEKVLASDPRWGARDRAFVAENTYGLVRWWRLISFLADGERDVVPETLTYEQGWRYFAVWHVYSGHELPPWAEFQNVDRATLENRLKEAKAVRRIRESITDWMDQTGEQELGAAWDAELHALNEPAEVIVRVNTLKISRNKLCKMLAEEGIDTSPVSLAPDALALKKRANLFRSPLFRQGLFEVQDAASQLVALFLDVAPGMRVIDACAGAGGKSLHLAALLQNKGRIVSMDVEQWKLDELKKRASRNGAQNIETRVIEGTKTIKRLHDSADRLLLDVPCSGLGVLKRNPDAKWKIDPAFVARIRQVQRDILASYPAMVKEGGKMVYATCSLLPSEGEEQVRWFLETRPGWVLEEEKRISPAQTGFDGFYMARLARS